MHQNMKRFLLLAMLLCGIACRAQDTLRYGDPSYWFVNYDSLMASGTEHPHFTTSNGMFNVMCVPTGPMPVLGVAVTLHEDVRDNPLFHYTAMFYEKQNDYGFWFVDSVQRSMESRKKAYYVYEMDGISPYTTFCEVVDVEELYFDTIHYIYDTMFVGIGSQRYDGDPVGVHMGLCGMVFGRNLSPSLSASFPVGCNGFRVTEDDVSGGSGCVYEYYEYVNWGGIFPIIGFHCYNKVTDAHVASATPEAMTVAWSDTTADAFQVAVGLYSKPVDSAFYVITTTENSVTIDSLLEQGENYAAWVRRQCRYSAASYDTAVWSDWGNRVVLHLPVGIDEVSSGIDITVAPNPADGILKVACSEPVQGLAIYDMAGRVVMKGSPQTPTCVVDVAAFPAGVYAVSVTTASGTGLRRLAVKHR